MTGLIWASRLENPVAIGRHKVQSLTLLLSCLELPYEFSSRTDTTTATLLGLKMTTTSGTRLVAWLRALWHHLGVVCLYPFPFHDVAGGRHLQLVFAAQLAGGLSNSFPNGLSLDDDIASELILSGETEFLWSNFDGCHCVLHSAQDVEMTRRWAWGLVSVSVSRFGGTSGFGGMCWGKRHADAEEFRKLWLKHRVDMLQLGPPIRSGHAPRHGARPVSS